MYSYEVGKCYQEAIRQEGTVFDLADDGAYLSVFFNKPTEDEVEQFKAEHPFEIRHIVLQNIAMFLVHIGDLNWMDAPYSPHLSRNLSKVVIPSGNDGLSLVVSLFDCSTGELKSLRYLSLSNKYTRKLFGDVMELKMKPFSKEEFGLSLREIYMKYSTKNLYKLSSPGYKIF